MKKKQTHNLILPIFDDYWWEFELNVPLHEIHCCIEAIITFRHQKIRCTTTKMHLLGILRDIRAIAKDLLARTDIPWTDEIPPGNYLMQDLHQVFLGHDTYVKPFYYNERLADKSNKFEYYTEFYGVTTISIYPDKDYNVIFDVTKNYPNRYGKKRKTRIPFTMWMRNYHSLYKFVVPREVLEQWIVWCNKMIEVIKTNNERMEREYEIRIGKPTEHCSDEIK